jgi:hypothetical protein
VGCGLFARLVDYRTRFYRRIDIQADAVIGYIANLPDPIAQQGHQMQQRMGLVDAQAIDIAPEGAGHRQAREFEKSAQHGVQAKIGKMPDAVKPDKQ